MHDLLLKMADPVGMVGAVLILFAYTMLSMGKWAGESMLYQLLNLIGVAMILFSLCFHWNFAAIVMESAWIVISFVGIYKITKTRKEAAI